MKITGCLTELGKSRDSGKKFCTYSMIEIGGEVIQNVIVRDEIDNYLRRGLSENVSLWYVKNGNKRFLFAVTLPDGKTYAWKTMPLLGRVLLRVIFIPLLVFGAALSLLVIGLPVLVGSWAILGIVNNHGAASTELSGVANLVELELSGLNA